jgi:hypothetical protein
MTMNFFIKNCAFGNYEKVDSAMKKCHLPIAYITRGLETAIFHGQNEILERLLQDQRADPSANYNNAVFVAAQRGHLRVLEILLQDRRVDPSVNNNCAFRFAARNGHLAVVKRLLEDNRVDPSTWRNWALRDAVNNGHHAVIDRLVERLLEDSHSSFLAVLESCSPEQKKYFEYRGKFTEICIALQSLNLPAWITMLIIKASYPWTTLPIHNQWKLVCAVKHFHKF